MRGRHTVQRCAEAAAEAAAAAAVEAAYTPVTGQRRKKLPHFADHSFCEPTAAQGARPVDWRSQDRRSKMDACTAGYGMPTFDGNFIMGGYRWSDEWSSCSSSVVSVDVAL